MKFCLRTFFVNLAITLIIQAAFELHTRKVEIFLDMAPRFTLHHEIIPNLSYIQRNCHLVVENVRCYRKLVITAAAAKNPNIKLTDPQNGRGIEEVKRNYSMCPPLSILNKRNLSIAFTTKYDC